MVTLSASSTFSRVAPSRTKASLSSWYTPPSVWATPIANAINSVAFLSNARGLVAACANEEKLYITRQYHGGVFPNVQKYSSSFRDRIHAGLQLSINIESVVSMQHMIEIKSS